jgi:hypothetical protein
MVLHQFCNHFNLTAGIPRGQVEHTAMLERESISGLTVLIQPEQCQGTGIFTLVRRTKNSS